MSSWATCCRLDSTGQPQPSTEEHVDSVSCDLSCDLSCDHEVPIGDPLLGTRLELLQEDGSSVEEGVGEICVGEHGQEER